MNFQFHLLLHQVLQWIAEIFEKKYFWRFIPQGINSAVQSEPSPSQTVYLPVFQEHLFVSCSNPLRKHSFVHKEQVMLPLLKLYGLFRCKRWTWLFSTTLTEVKRQYKIETIRNIFTCFVVLNVSQHRSKVLANRKHFTI